MEWVDTLARIQDQSVGILLIAVGCALVLTVFVAYMLILYVPQRELRYRECQTDFLESLLKIENRIDKWVMYIENNSNNRADKLSQSFDEIKTQMLKSEMALSAIAEALNLLGERLQIEVWKKRLKE